MLQELHEELHVVQPEDRSEQWRRMSAMKESLHWSRNDLLDQWRQGICPELPVNFPLSAQSSNVENGDYARRLVAQ
jgi:hypothetical protein